MYKIVIGQHPSNCKYRSARLTVRYCRDVLRNADLPTAVRYIGRYIKLSDPRRLDEFSSMPWIHWQNVTTGRARVLQAGGICSPPSPSETNPTLLRFVGFMLLRHIDHVLSGFARLHRVATFKTARGCVCLVSIQPSVDRAYSKTVNTLTWGLSFCDASYARYISNPVVMDIP